MQLIPPSHTSSKLTRNGQPILMKTCHRTDSITSHYSYSCFPEHRPSTRQLSNYTVFHVYRMGRIFEVNTSAKYHKSDYGDIPHRAVWETFKSNTTAHGIPHVNNARGNIFELPLISYKTRQLSYCKLCSNI